MIINQDDHFTLEINQDNLDYFTIRSTYAIEGVKDEDSIVLSKDDLLKLKEWIEENVIE
ncbi:hypothetical protein [Solibacillus sp. FSL H8-0538]|uniref:hypothetical protein n=1 Tax=Solibacillus sp. FSL H8-0538 TaxID=2921400 RepID=UPI0030FCA200